MNTARVFTVSQGLKRAFKGINSISFFRRFIRRDDDFDGVDGADAFSDFFCVEDVLKPGPIHS